MARTRHAPLMEVNLGACCSLDHFDGLELLPVTRRTGEAHWLAGDIGYYHTYIEELLSMFESTVSRPPPCSVRRLNFRPSTILWIAASR